MRRRPPRAGRPGAAGAALLAAALLAAGCYQTRYVYEGPKLLTTGPGLGADARVVEHFRAHERQFYLFYGLLPVGRRVNGAEMAARAVGAHDGAVNLRFSDGQDLADMAVSHVLCVLGLLCGTWSTWAEGDVVQVVGPRQQVWIGPPEGTAVAGDGNTGGGGGAGPAGGPGGAPAAAGASLPASPEAGP